MSRLLLVMVALGCVFVVVEFFRSGGPETAKGDVAFDLSAAVADAAGKGQQDVAAVLSQPGGERVSGLSRVTALSERALDEVERIDASTAGNSASNLPVNGDGTWSVSLRLINGESKVPIANARVVFRRLADGREVTSRSDQNGTVVGEALQGESWQLTVDEAGFKSESREILLEDSVLLDTVVVDDRHVFDLGVVALQPLHAVRFELVGCDAWSDPSAFSIQSLEEGIAIPVDDLGLAEVSYAELPAALNVRVNYPDGTEGWERFDSSEISLDRPFRILVGGDRRLELDLRLTSSVRLALEGVDSYVRATFIDTSGAVRFVAQRMDGERAYVFPQVQATSVNVGLVTPGEGQQVEWAAETHPLNELGVTPVILLVASPPRQLLFVDGDDTPVPNVSWRLKPSDASTSWTAGGLTDENGTARIPMDIEAGPLFLSADTVEATWQLFDSEFQSLDDQAALVVRVEPRREWSIELSSNGLLPGNATAWVSGSQTNALTYPLEFDAEGKTDKYLLVDGSHAEFTIVADGFWTVQETYSLAPGTNQVEVYQLGKLEARSVEDLRRYTSVELGVGVSKWMDDGRIEIRTSSSGVVAVVPIGDYLSVSKDGGEERIEVVASRE